MLTSICKKCGHSHSFEFTSSVNVSNNPDLKEAIISGDYFTWTCSECGFKNLINYPFLYNDSHLIILMTNANLQSSEVPDGYTARIVRSFGDLIEKIKIFDSGLDDVVIEMCKYVIREESGKDLSLKYLQLDGADGNLIFAYPENGNMAMLQLGFNVYEDCAGIVNRHPNMRGSASEMIVVDRDWIEGFL